MTTTANTRLYHVLFDGKPEIVCHICPIDRQDADVIPCLEDGDTTGECRHVQYAACDCLDASCAVCGDAA